MKKYPIIAVLLSIAILATFPGMPVSAAQLPESVETMGEEEQIDFSGSASLDAEYALLGEQKIIDNVKSAVVFEANSMTLIYAWNADLQMYPASFVKIMTAMLALEKCSLTDIVTVSGSATSSIPFDAVSADLIEGEKLSMEDLLFCLLTGSANDAAVVIAEHVSGTQAAFVAEMNARAKELGCNATQFTNPHGLHDENQHTTARDSAKIFDAALRNEDFKRIFVTDEYNVLPTNKSSERHLSSGNFMKDTTSALYYDPRVLGGRTGVSGDGRRCLASVAEQNGMQIITVVMGAESVYLEDDFSAVSIGGYKETTKLLDLCFERYKTAQVLYANQALRQFGLEDGACDVIIGPNCSITTVLPQGATVSDLVFQYNDVLQKAPVEKGQLASRLQIMYNGMCVAQVDLFAMNKVAQKQTDTAAGSNADDSGISWLIWCVLGAIIGIVSVVAILRFQVPIKRLFRVIRRKHFNRDRKRSR